MFYFIYLYTKFPDYWLQSFEILIFIVTQLTAIKYVVNPYKNRKLEIYISKPVKQEHGLFNNSTHLANTLKKFLPFMYNINTIH